MNAFANKTVLITGATGLVGSHIVKQLMAEKQVNVIALSRNKKKLEECFALYLSNPRFSYIAQDVSEKLCVNSPIDYIFHAAGPIEAKIIKEMPVSVIEPNILGTINCCELLKEQLEHGNHKGRLIIFSSETVYGHSIETEKIVQENDTDSSDCLSSVNAVYSQSKRMSEVIGQAYCRQFGIDYVVARLAYVYGDTFFEPNTAFYELLHKALCGEDIVMNNNIFLRRDNIYVDDAVDGVLRIAASGKIGEAYNVSSNGDASNYKSIVEIVECIAKTVNKDNTKCEVKVYQKDRLPFEYKPGIKMDNGKLKSLGWKINTTLEDGVEKIVKLKRNRIIAEV